MNDKEFEQMREKHKCKDCGYWLKDVDCGHTDKEHEICGDFYLSEN